MTDEEQERSTGAEMGIALFRRYSEKQAAGILGVSAATLQRIRFRGGITYLHISKRTIQYFGKHLVEYILQSEQKMKPIEAVQKSPSKNITRNQPSKTAILESVRRSLGARPAAD